MALTFGGSDSRRAFLSKVPVAFLATVIARSALAEQKQYNLASGTQGGAFYTWAGVLAAVARAENLDLSVQSANTAVSAALLQKRTLDFGMILPLDAREALREVPFDKSHLRTITMFSPNGWVVIALRQSGIQTLADLRGRRVAWGPSGHIQSVANELVFKSIGLDPAELKRVYISAGQGISGLRDGVIDAVAYSPSFPSPQLTEAATLPGGVRLVGLTDDQIRKVNEASGNVFVRTVFPPSTQSELKQDLVTVAQWSQLATHDEMPEDVVFQLARILHTKHALLVSQYKGFENATPEKTIALAAFPIHAGVERYFRDIGIRR